MLGIAWDQRATGERRPRASGSVQGGEGVEHSGGVIRDLDDHGRPFGVDVDGKGEEAAASLLAPGQVYELPGGARAFGEPKLDTPRSCPGSRRHRGTQGGPPFLDALGRGARGESAGDGDLHTPTI